MAMLTDWPLVLAGLTLLLLLAENVFGVTSGALLAADLRTRRQDG